ncbi:MULTISPECIES: hypothetical protein [Prochlorococcus]|uniref:hypothetical protein n=1 Tax=Prochlorococcus TaxID=1218 RepID=UPI0005339E77|nr:MULTISPECIES: hypothetical protein [Prochlorococcus]KGG14145.1 hypothetical protein EV05_0034 [Prochlorococcus sp. MIT 0601]
MTKPLEFSSFFVLLNAIKEGDLSKKEELSSILIQYKEGNDASSFLDELGQLYLYIAIQELFNYTSSMDLKLIGKYTKEDWDELANKNNCDLPVFLANAMINHVKDNQVIEQLASKWQTPEREVRKHIRQLSAYITEGIIDVLE